MTGEIDEAVEILDYDIRWPSWYLLDAQELRQALGARLHEPQHFGSTSVPGLPAKPIIDILVAPRSWPLGTTEYALFLRLGYEYLGEAGVPGRDYWRRRTAHATNLAVVRAAGALWNDGARSLLEYSRAKHDFVNDLLARARRWRGGP